MLKRAARNLVVGVAAGAITMTLTSGPPLVASVTAFVVTLLVAWAVHE